MRRRLVLVTLATTTMIALAFVLPLAVLVRDVAEERALIRGRQVASVVAPTLLTGDRGVLEAALSGTDPALLTSVVLPDGEVVGADVPDAVDLAPARDGAAYTVELDGGDVLVTPVIRPDDGTSIVVVQVPAELERRGVAAAWGMLAVLAVALVSGAVLLADRLGRSVTRPAATVTDTARRLGAGDLAARAPVDGPPEVADIAVALNQLADRIDTLVREEREAVADLSHRLRTPLTALRLDIDTVASVDDRDRLTADLDALERSVDRLIRDARAGADAGGARDVTDLVAVVRDRSAWWATLAEDQGRDTTLQLRLDSAPVRASRDELTDALDALLGNVFAHTPEGTAYGITLDGRGAGEVEVAVHDAGPGLGSIDGPVRGVSGAGSTGLGLDIVQRVAVAAGGRLDLGSGPGGTGAWVALILPLVGPNGQAGRGTVPGTLDP